jgi:hypothetical protein
MNKKTFISKSLIALFALGILTTSCKKDDDDTTPPANPPAPAAPAKPIPSFAGSTGVWAAIVYTTTNAGIPVEISMGTGGMFKANGTYRDCGTVTLDGYSLKKQANKFYLWTSTSGNIWSTSNPEANWNISGSTSDSVPLILHTTNVGFPVVSEIMSSSTISKSSGHTVVVGAGGNPFPITNADSVIIVLTVGNKTFTRTYDASTTSNNFMISSSDLTGMSGNGLLQLVAYKWENDAGGQENIFFVNEKIVSQTIKVQ